MTAQSNVRGEVVYLAPENELQGPRQCEDIFIHMADQAAIEGRKFLGIAGEGHFAEFLKTSDGAGLLKYLRRYAAFELLKSESPQ